MDDSRFERIGGGDVEEGDLLVVTRVDELPENNAVSAEFGDVIVHIPREDRLYRLRQGSVGVLDEAGFGDLWDVLPGLLGVHKEGILDKVEHLLGEVHTLERKLEHAQNNNARLERELAVSQARAEAYMHCHDVMAQVTSGGKARDRKF